MISVHNSEAKRVEDRVMAEIACRAADFSIDTYSDYGVGAAVEIQYAVPEGEEYHVYSGTNIRLSGMEYTVHAEQLALFNALADVKRTQMDSYATLNRVFVHTSENDHSLRCGHCLQVAHGVCCHMDQSPETVDYCSVKAQTLMTEYGPEGVDYDIREHKLTDLLPPSYTENREDY